MTKEGSDCYGLGVLVVINYELDHFTGSKEFLSPDLSKFITGYLDLQEEKVKFEIAPNPYFDSVTVIDYDGGFVEKGWLSPEFLSKEKYEEVLKEHFHAVKNDNASFEKTGESHAYFYVDEKGDYIA